MKITHTKTGTVLRDKGEVVASLRKRIVWSPAAGGTLVACTDGETLWLELERDNAVVETTSPIADAGGAFFRRLTSNR